MFSLTVPRVPWRRRIVVLAGFVMILGGLGPLTRATAQSTALYVAQGGIDTDNNCQTQNTPCATISRALVVASPGDTIEVSGTVDDQVTVPSSLSRDHH